MAFTLEQLQKMGATPVQPSVPTAPKAGKSYTADQLIKIGATPIAPAQVELVKPTEPTEALAKPAGFSITETLKNIPPSAARFVGDIAGAITSPIETAKGLGRVAVSGVEKLIPGEQALEAEARGAGRRTEFEAVTDYFRERYGGIENLKKTIQEDPVGFLADASAFIGGAGAAVKGAAKVTGITKAAIPAQALAKVGKAVEPVSAITKVAKVVAGPVVRRIATRLEPVGERLISSALKLTPTATRKISRANLAGKTPERWLFERGISGSPENIVEKLESIRNVSKSSVDQGLARIPDKFRFTRINEALGVLKTVFEDVPGNEDILNRINRLRSIKTYNLSEMNEVKRMIDKELNIFAKSGEIKSGATARGLRNIRGDIQKFIENNAARLGFEDVKALNKETQVSKEIQDAVNATEARRGSNRILGLTDLIVGTGVGVGVDPITGAVFVIGKKLAESPTFKTAVAKQIRRLSADDFYQVVKVAEGDEIPNSRFRVIMQKVVNAAKDEATRVGAFEAGRIKEAIEEK